LDIAANVFWGGRSERCFMDVHVFNPLAPSNSSSSLSSTFKKHENIKRRAYGQCNREVERASFTPIVLSATGRFAHEASVFYKRLACILPPSGVMWSLVGFVVASVSRYCTRSAVIQCVRGARSSIGVFSRTPPPIDLVRVESSLS